MLKERIQEVFDFTKSESPYKKANKGWINQDIFLDLSPSADSLKQKDEAANVTLFWAPINNLLFNIFLVISVSSIMVVTSLSLEKGKFNFDLFNSSLINDMVNVEDNNIVQTSDMSELDDTNSEDEKNSIIDEANIKNNINSSNDNQIYSDLSGNTNEIDKEKNLVESDETNKDTIILKNIKSKSNFI